MNTKNTKASIAIHLCALIACVSTATVLRGADSGTMEPNGDVKQTLNEQLNAASNFYDFLQSKEETSIPNAVVEQAQGVLIVNRWVSHDGSGSTGGYVIGLRRSGNGHFSPPVFYAIRGASVDVKMGKDKTQAIVFLMTDKSLGVLSGNNIDWNHDLKAIPGPNSPKLERIDSSVDVVLYKKENGLDVDGTLSAIRITYDADRNGKFYGKPGISAYQIFADEVKAPIWTATAFAVNLNRQDAGLNPHMAPIVNQSPVLPGTTTTATVPAGQVLPVPNSPTSPNVATPAQQAINNSLPGQ